MTGSCRRLLAAACVACASAAFTGCDTAPLDPVSSSESRLVLTVGNVQVVPSPAFAGDTVKLAFDLVIKPERRFTATVFVDGRRRVSEMRSERFEGVFEIVLGPAADLAAVFGKGFHTARLDLRAGPPGHTIVVQEAVFELR